MQASQCSAGKHLGERVVSIGTGSSTSAYTTGAVVCRAEDLGFHLRSTALATPKAVVAIHLCTDIELNRHWLGLERAALLARTLAQTREPLRLRSFNAQWTSMGATGASALIDVLRNAPKLARLDLSGNWIGDAGSAALVRLLRKSRTLRVLRLRWNGFTEEAIGPIRIALRTTRGGKVLEELDLGGNWLKNGGATRLAHAFYKNPFPSRNPYPKLRVLRLDMNGIQSAGLTAIVQALNWTNVWP